ncbi:hypothetical protein PGTUg99_005523 [Puccinia graminis f. sp. tritici]|uniref:Chromo domain-containing protein n=1 Tax=Puccinia graminis f. sp. tritici TaxID=56615 RepID=A0A5B0RKQ6_PUCGR|nr:hypothetical protein PGTUg99_005523 [Puccinia graminis f. sp. tritici]
MMCLIGMIVLVVLELIIGVSATWHRDDCQLNNLLWKVNSSTERETWEPTHRILEPSMLQMWE